MKPSIPFSKAADQLCIRLLTLQRSAMPQPGRVMFWRGRKLLGIGDIATLGDLFAIPKDTVTICASDADYDDLLEWGFK